MPAAAVIPAPIAYIKVVAVKKLVVGFRGGPAGPPQGEYWSAALPLEGPTALHCSGRWEFGTFTLKKLECSKQADCLNTLAWNNGIGPRSYFVGFWDRSND